MCWHRQRRSTRWMPSWIYRLNTLVGLWPVGNVPVKLATPIDIFISIYYYNYNYSCLILLLLPRILLLILLLLLLLLTSTTTTCATTTTTMYMYIYVLRQGLVPLLMDKILHDLLRTLNYGNYGIFLIWVMQDFVRQQ